MIKGKGKKKSWMITKKENYKFFLDHIRISCKEQ